MTATRGASENVSQRWPRTVIERVDEHAAEMAKARPGETVTRTTATVSLIVRMLDQLYPPQPGDVKTARPRARRTGR